MKISKNVKYGLVVAGCGLLTYIIVRALKKKDEDTGEGLYVDISSNTGNSKPVKVSSSTTLDKTVVLGEGSKGDEVKALQKILGVTADGVFGPKTLAALKAQTGSAQTSLKSIEAAIAASKAKSASIAAINNVKTNFPIGKSVIAKIKVRAYSQVNRNNDWFSTDNDGNPLPSKEFLETANVGTVADYRKSDPSIVIVKLATPIEGKSFAAFKSTWLK